MGTGSAFGQEQLEKILVGAIRPREKKAPTLLKRQHPKVIILSGPTACGKTEMSLHLAQALRAEIISADSMQVYKGMDIGTAKATNYQRRLVPHHLIDICNIDQPFNVVDYYNHAYHCCRNLSLHNVVPLVVGGSGFYLHSLIYGPPNGPAPIPEVRKALESEADRLGIETLFERLKEQDPIYAESITAHDRHKIIRGLEIITLTGNRVSSLQWKKRQVSMNFDFRCWFIHRSRENLRQRVDARCDEMIESGLLNEISELKKQGLENNSSASQAIGYRHGLEYLKSHQTEEDFSKFVRDFKQASKRYVKRQFTWFRKELSFKWIDLELHDMETAADIIIQDYKRN